MIESCINTILFVVFITQLIVGGSCQALQNAKDLLSDKLVGYNKNLRPIEDQGSPLEVRVGFELLAICEVNEVTQTVTINTQFDLAWVDVTMKWDPSQYGYLYHVFAENNQFWTPTLVLTTSTERMKRAGNDWLGIRYDFQGNAYYYPGEIFASSCDLDITYYPFDQHECAFIFTPWGQPPEEIDLINTSDKVGQSYFMPNGAWEVVDSDINVVRAHGVILYKAKIIIKRLPRYTIINVILPIIFLSMLNLLVFMIPADSGERVSFCITLLLAIAVFLTIISDNLPKTSFPMSILSYYLLAVLVISICMTLATIYSLSLHHRDDSETINRVWKRLVNITKWKCCDRRDIRTPDSNDAIIGNRVNPLPVIETELFEKGNGESHPQKQLLSRPTLSLDGEVATNSNEQPKLTWRHVSIVFDRVCFMVFSLILVISTITLFGILVR